MPNILHRLPIAAAPGRVPELVASKEGINRAAESESMAGGSTDWAAYLMGLKAGAGAGDFSPYPKGELSRSDRVVAG